MPKEAKSAATFPERKKAAMYAKMDVWQARIARLLVILMLCFQPLFITPNRYLLLTGDKYRFFLVYMCIILAAALIVWIARMTRTPPLRPRGKLTIPDWAVLGFASVTIVSAIFSPFSGEANVWVGIPERFDGAITQLLYVAAFFVISRWYSPKIRDFVFFGFSAILVALIGILQFYGMDFLGLWPYDDSRFVGIDSYNIWFRSTLGNVNIVSTYTCVAILLSGFLFVRTKSKWRCLWLAASALNFWLMEIARSDSGKVGLIVAMVLAIPFIVENMKSLGKTMILGSTWLAAYTVQMLLYDVPILQIRTSGSLLPYALAAIVLLAVGLVLAIKGKDSDPKAPVKWKLGVILIAVCIIAGFAGLEILGRTDPETPRYDFVYEMREVMHGNIRDEFGSARVYIWRNALEVFPNNPIIGSGPDTFYNAFPSEAHGYMGQDYQNAHNEYLQILICQGILGLLCYLVFLGGILPKPIRAAFRNPLLVAALVAFVGYCGQAFFNLSLPITSQLLWVLAGMLASKRNHELAAME